MRALRIVTVATMIIWMAEAYVVAKQRHAAAKGMTAARAAAAAKARMVRLAQ